MNQPSAGGQERPRRLADMTTEQLMQEIRASKNGLSQAEAAARLQQFGYNELPEKKRSPLLTFLTYFWGPIAWMIEIAAALSLVIGHWADFGIIMVLLFANALVGFWEEYQASNTIAALKEQLALKATVIRDGEWRVVPSRELVPGDVLRLKLGAIVPADARLMDGDPVQVDQAALTGESLPVEKKPGENVFSGSVLKQGEIDALVYATGKNTYFGETAKLVEEAHLVSHFQKAVLKIGDYLIWIALVLALLVIVVALFRGDNMLTTLQFVLVLTVAAIPVAMPTVLTVTMAVGAKLLARENAVVTRLAAVEELAGIDVLCSDKTGTLTENRLTISDPYVVEGFSAQDAILAGALASRAEDQDPIDLAILDGLKGDRDQLRQYQVTHFTPFDPVHKRTEAEIKGPDGVVFKVSKGAPQVIIGLASPEPAIKEATEQAIQAFAKRGFRSLGVARADEDGDWRLIGVLPLYDPPRPDSKDTLSTAREMGINPKMITGDQVAIAKETSRTLGLGTNIVDAQVFEEKRQDTDALADEVERADGFAQVFPEHKFRIVEILQKRGHIVGMTGDGVNDAPPLKKADAGIAVNTATDAARAAADISLLSPGLTVIIDAVKESRKIFQRMTSYATYRIAETIRVLLFMTLAIVIFNFYPVTAIMIVMLALLNDTAMLSIAYDRVRYSNQPEKWDMRRVLTLATVLGTLGVIETFGLFYLLDRVFVLGRPLIQSLLFLKLAVSGHFTIFVVRTRGAFWSIRPSNVLLLAVLGAQIIALLIVAYGLFMLAAGWKWTAIVWGYSVFWFLVEDRVKLAVHEFLEPDSSFIRPASKHGPR